MANEPIALVKLGSDEVVAYACGKCRVVVSGVGKKPGMFEDAQAREIAEKHCGPWTCEKCGAEHTRRYQSVCEACFRVSVAASQAEKEAARFAKAEKIYKWDGPVYAEDMDRYFRDVGDLIDSCECEDIAVPEYVWPCFTDHPRLDAEHIEEMALDDLPDGAELDAVDELKAFIEQWNAKQTYEVWEPSYRQVLVLESVGE